MCLRDHQTLTPTAERRPLGTLLRGRQTHTQAVAGGEEEAEAGAAITGEIGHLEGQMTLPVASMWSPKVDLRRMELGLHHHKVRVCPPPG